MDLNRSQILALFACCTSVALNSFYGPAGVGGNFQMRALSLCRLAPDCWPRSARENNPIASVAACVCSSWSPFASLIINYDAQLDDLSAARFLLLASRLQLQIDCSLCCLTSQNGRSTDSAGNLWAVAVVFWLVVALRRSRRRRRRRQQ